MTMIEYISGRLITHDESSIVIEQGGIGYYIHVPAPDSAWFCSQADEKGSVMVYTELIIREDSMTLYGFCSPAERSMFRMLISVSRVGPQIGCAILSHASIDQIAAAILQEQEEVLTSVPGIGPKNAKRIILELKDKMKKYHAETHTHHLKGTANRLHTDALLALISLGFSEKEAKHAIQEVLSASASSNREKTVQSQNISDVSALIKDALAILRND